MPFRPWAKAVYEFRRFRGGLDDPHVRCQPAGGIRFFTVPNGMEFIQQPELNRIIMIEGENREWRRVAMEPGRQHPPEEQLNPSYFGDSIGWWEGDTLVVDTVGFNEKFWMIRGGMPHTKFLHITERFTRLDFERVAVRSDDRRQGRVHADLVGRLDPALADGRTTTVRTAAKSTSISVSTTSAMPSTCRIARSKRTNDANPLVGVLVTAIALAIVVALPIISSAQAPAGRGAAPTAKPAAPPAGPPPRLPNGQINLGAVPGQKGFWNSFNGQIIGKNGQCPADESDD